MRVRVCACARVLHILLVQTQQSGRLSLSDVYSSLTALGLRPDPELIKDMVSKYDSDANGFIDEQEFGMMYGGEFAQRALWGGRRQEETEGKGGRVGKEGSADGRREGRKRDGRGRGRRAQQQAADRLVRC